MRNRVVVALTVALAILIGAARPAGATPTDNDRWHQAVVQLAAQDHLTETEAANRLSKLVVALAASDRPTIVSSAICAATTGTECRDLKVNDARRAWAMLVTGAAWKADLLVASPWSSAMFMWINCTAEHESGWQSGASHTNTGGWLAAQGGTYQSLFDPAFNLIAAYNAYYGFTAADGFTWSPQGARAWTTSVYCYQFALAA
jgi:hypothetical protein